MAGGKAIAQRVADVAFEEGAITDADHEFWAGVLDTKISARIMAYGE